MKMQKLLEKTSKKLHEVQKGCGARLFELADIKRYSDQLVAYRDQLMTQTIDRKYLKSVTLRRV
jgi:hypothetical protein